MDHRCARCGHRPGGCDRCAVHDVRLGAWIDGRPYCHTLQDVATCYEEQRAEDAAAK